MKTLKNKKNLTKTRKNGGMIGSGYFKRRREAKKARKLTNKILDMRNNNIYRTSQISMQPNTDPEYQEIGIIHLSVPGAINIVREVGTSAANIFGNTGFQRSRYDRKRKEALEDIRNMLHPNQKVCNIRVDIESGQPFFIHIFGSLLEKVNSGQTDE